MDNKYNSSINSKFINNHIIYNLKSTSQKISMAKEQNIKNNNDQDQKSIDDEHKNLTNSSQNDKSSKLNNNLTNDELSLDNISNMISQKKNKLPDTHMLFEDNESSKGDKKYFTNTYQKKMNKFNSFSNNNNIEVWDSHTKTFHLKMKKMKEMNKTIIKENYTTKNNKTFSASSKYGKNINNDLPNSFNNSKSIVNFKQKIIYMKNKNKLLNNGNIHFDDTQNNNSNGSLNINNIINENNNNKKIEEDKTIPFLCCFSKS